MVGAYEAKTRFSQLLERVIRGEVITVSLHGVPVAQLGPIDKRREDARAAVAEIKRLREGNRLDGLRIKDLIEEGRM